MVAASHFFVFNVVGMGFFVLDLERRVRIHPRFFGAKLLETLTQRLTQEVEGTFAGRHGFIVTVLKIQQPLPSGQLDESDSTGSAIFPLCYKAIVFRPFKGEVLDAIVFRVVQHGFFCETGPLTVFVSHHQLPTDLRFDAQSEVWSTPDDEDRIEKDSAVRIKILGLKIEATEISATGTIKESYLGPIE